MFIIVTGCDFVLLKILSMRFILAGAFILYISMMALGQRSSPLSSDERLAIQVYEDTLSVLARGVLTAELTEDRVYACHQMIPILVKALKTTNSFKYSFPRLENVSMIYPLDSTFRIFSWQLKVNDAEYRYFGAIQWDFKELKLIPLADRSSNLPNPKYQETNADQWYGVVYYGLKSFKMTNQSEGYLLFGYDGFGVTERRKVIDLLYFKKGVPKFGAPVFKVDKGQLQTRLIYEFSADAAVRVNYDEAEGMIVCDHLTANQGLLPGQGKTMVPDGSYEGFKLEKGIWKYVNEVFPSGSGSNQRAFSTKPKQ